MTTEATKLIIGNWKMHKTSEEASTFIQTLSSCFSSPPKYSEAWLAVPFTAIAKAAEAAAHSSFPIRIGAQNMHDAEEGAYTGEISARMLKEAGASFVVLGHSERRRLFFESDEWIHRKVVRAIESGLRVILCVGEDKGEREAGKTEEVLQRQLLTALQGFSEEIQHVLIAYEPVWVIGKTAPAPPEMIEKEHLVLRKIVQAEWNNTLAKKIKIVYGGSVNSDNAKTILEEADVDGLLIGGASLSLESFSAILQGK